MIPRLIALWFSVGVMWLVSASCYSLGTKYYHGYRSEGSLLSCSHDVATRDPPLHPSVRRFVRSDDSKEEIGKSWSSNSKKRAKGNKQVDLKDGAMHITFQPVADHAVSVVHPAEFQDGRITLRFNLPTEADGLGLNFADMKFKEVHAGHFCMTKISTKNVQINDLKTGVMANAIRKARLAKTITPEKTKMLKTKTKRFQNKLEAGKWHNLVVTLKGDTMKVVINDKEVASFSSAGIAHPTKRVLRVAVPKKAIIDDLKIYSLQK